MPPTTKQQVATYLDRALVVQLNERARANERSAAAEIRHALRKHLASTPNEGAEGRPGER